MPEHPTPQSTVADRAALAVVALIYVAGLALVANRSQAAPTVTATAPPAAVSEAGALRVADLSQPGEMARHSIAFTLRPGAGYEFKYRLDKNAGMVYAWNASAPVKFELHGEPDGATPGYADTYRVGEAAAARGVFVAPSKGIHGWYWENNSGAPVTITLQASGYFTAALELAASGAIEHPLQR